MSTYQEVYEFLVMMRAVINGFIDRRYDCMYYYSEQYDWYGDKFHSWSIDPNTHDCELFSYPMYKFEPTTSDCTEYTNDGSGETLIFCRTYVPDKYTKCGNVYFSDEEFTEEYFFQLSVLYEPPVVLLFSIAAYFKDMDQFCLDLKYVRSLYEVQKYLKPSKKDVS